MANPQGPTWANVGQRGRYGRCNEGHGLASALLTTLVCLCYLRGRRCRHNKPIGAMFTCGISLCSLRLPQGQSCPCAAARVKFGRAVTEKASLGSAIFLFRDGRHWTNDLIDRGGRSRVGHLHTRDAVGGRGVALKSPLTT